MVNQVSQKSRICPLSENTEYDKKVDERKKLIGKLLDKQFKRRLKPSCEKKEEERALQTRDRWDLDISNDGEWDLKIFQ